MYAPPMKTREKASSSTFQATVNYTNVFINCLLLSLFVLFSSTKFFSCVFVCLHYMDVWVSSMNDIYCCYKHHVGVTNVGYRSMSEVANVGLSMFEETTTY
jgi:hypothetical protein